MAACHDPQRSVGAHEDYRFYANEINPVYCHHATRGTGGAYRSRYRGERPTCTLARYVHISTLSRAYLPNSLQTSSQSPISRRSPSSRRNFPPPYTCLAGLNLHGLTPHWHSRPLPLYMPQLPHSRRTFCHSFPVLGALQSKLSQLPLQCPFPD